MQMLIVVYKIGGHFMFIRLIVFNCGEQTVAGDASSNDDSHVLYVSTINLPLVKIVGAATFAIIPLPMPINNEIVVGVVFGHATPSSNTADLLIQ